MAKNNLPLIATGGIQSVNHVITSHAGRVFNF